jgi:hypothetical protein
MSTALPQDLRREVDRRQWQALVLGVAALVPCVVGAFFDPPQFFRAYLAAYQFFLGFALGSMVILTIYHLTGGAWGFLVRRTLEAAMRTLPLLAVLFVPIACGLPYLYLWAQDWQVKAFKDLQHKEVYLYPPFFWGRAALYFILWMGMAYLLNAWSRRQDEAESPRPGRKMTRLSGPVLIVYGITITFASVDWLMSLQPSFHSTIFGPIYAGGQILSALCLALIVLAWLLVRSPVGGRISQDALNDLGNLLLTFLVIWTYLVWFQFMLVWIANLPYEVSWYLPRIEGGWRWVAWALFVLHFAVPFLLLLGRDVKRDPKSLAQVAGLLLVMQVVFVYWQTMPAFNREAPGIAQHWMDFLTPLGLGGLWLADFLWELKRAPLLPRHDPNREAAIHVREVEAEMAHAEEVLHG